MEAPGTPVPVLPRPVAEPPGLKQEAARLRAEREALAAERDKVLPEAGSPGLGDSEEMTRLRARVAELLARLNARGGPARPKAPDPVRLPTPPPVEKPTPAPAAAAEPFPDGTPPADPFLLAQALFRAADFDGALRTYRKLDQDSLTREDRVMAQFMIACCLRKLGKLEEAASVYREVANAREDEVLTDCALWHLSAIRWRRDMETQLEEIRQRRRSR
jgi:hypothetical protein